MAQPPTYSRQYSFTGFQTTTPDDPLPAIKVDLEYNTIKITLDAILANLALIQRDDGALANLSVGAEQLEVSLRTGINPPTVWTVAPTAYSVNDTVVFIDDPRSELWLCVTAHTSTADFDTDSLTSLYWTKLADFSFIAFDAGSASYDNTTSGLTATDVQAALDELAASVGGAGGVSDGDKGDITVASSGTVWTIDAGAVDATALATDAVETAKIKDVNVTTAKIADLAVSTAKLNTGAVTAAKIDADAVTTTKILDDNVTLAKLAHGTQGGVLYYGASGVPTELAVGTSGQVLTTAGAGANPSWAAAPGAFDVQVFTSDGTWTKPSGASRVYVRMWAGGGSGAVHTSSEAACGGGGGEYVEGWFDASALGATEAVVVGAGGAAVDTSSQNGNVGEDSTFDSLTAKGGGGGVQGTDSSNRLGGSGGSQIAGYENGAGGTITAVRNGIYSGAGGAWNTSNVLDGGNAKFGGGGGGAAQGGGANTSAAGTSQLGGAGGAAAIAGAATAGSVPGGGGGGCTNTTAASGAGGAGRVEVYTWA